MIAHLPKIVDPIQQQITVLSLVAGLYEEAVFVGEDAIAYSFKYSTRPGTPAAERAQVPEDAKNERLQQLQALLTQQQRAAQDAMVGKTVGVLFERAGRLPGQMVGKSDHLHAVHVANCPAPAGTLATVRIVSSGANSLAGELAG